MKDSWIYGLLGILSLGLMLGVISTQSERVLAGANDFLAFYSGARLLDTGELYDNDRLQEVSRERTGMSSPEHGYIRLPFHAAFVWPLSRLPYKTAYLLWELLLAGAFAGFIALWRPPHLMAVFCFSMMSLAAFAAMSNGQDDTFLLLFLALTAWLHRKGRIFLAGAVLSLCAIKFHLFLLTPVILAGLRAWRFTRGFLAGGAALAVISFLAAGWSWPGRFVKSILTPEFTPIVTSMPNLRGLMAGLGLGLPGEVAAGASLAAAAWIVARRGDFEKALATSVAGGLLLSGHAYAQDLTVLLPAALYSLATTKLPPLRLVSLFLLIPVTPLLTLLQFPYSAVTVAAIVLYVWLMAFEQLRTEPAT